MIKKQIKRIANFNFSITGLTISLILVAMFSSMFGLFMAELNNEYGSPGDYNNSFDKYNEMTANLTSNADGLRSATEINQETGILDIIGGFFSSGWNALKTSWNSFSLFEGMISDATSDVPELGIFKDYIILITLIALVIGVGITVLVKWKV